MARTALPSRILVKMTDDDRAKLAEVARILGLDQSATIRMCVAEKYHALVTSVAPRAPAKKKRRAAP
jgi:hypothetical protein